MENIVPLINPIASSDKIQYITLTNGVRTALNAVIFQIKKYLHVRQTDAFLYDSKGCLSSYVKLEHPEGIIKLARYSCVTMKPLHIIPGQTKLPARVIQKIGDLSFSSCYAPIHVNNVCIGLFYAGDPWLKNNLQHIHFRQLQFIANAFAKILKDAQLDTTKELAYNPMPETLYFVQKNIYRGLVLRRFKERFTSLIEVSNLIHSYYDHNELIRIVIASTKSVLGSESASLFMLDSKTNELYFHVVAGSESPELIGKRIPPGEGVVGLCVQKKEPIIVNNAINDERVYHKITDKTKVKTRNLMAVPLLVDNNCIGVLEVINTVDRPAYTPEDLLLFQSLSASVAIAIQKQILMDDLAKTNVQLNKELKESITLHAIVAILVEAKNTNELFYRSLNLIKKNLGVHALAIFLYNESKNELVLGSMTEESELWITNNIPTEKLWQCYNLCETLHINNLKHDSENSKTTLASASGSCLLVPLKEANQTQVYGVLCGWSLQENAFTSYEYHMIATISLELSRGYQSFQMKEDLIEKKTMQRELEIAKKMQQHILPSSFPTHNYVKLDARAIMARNVGGDLYYYYAEGPDSPVTILIGDVSGKSLSGALFMAVASSILKTIIKSEIKPPAEILTKANNLLYTESQDGMFVTLFLVYYDPQTGILQYSSAGHNQMILMHSNGDFEILNSKGMPLGTIPSKKNSYINKEIKIKHDDTLILYTDGITEAEDVDGNEFGLEKLLDLIRNNSIHNVSQLTSILTETALEYSYDKNLIDDIALLVARFNTKTFKKEALDYKFHLPAKQEIMHFLINRAEEILKQHQLKEQIYNDILVIIEEALVNIITHAYKNTKQENPKFDCNISLDKKKKIFKLEFFDKGSTFNFNDVVAPSMKDVLDGKIIGGFGVPLLKGLSDKIQYTNEEGVNILRIEKCL